MQIFLISLLAVRSSGWGIWAHKQSAYIAHKLLNPTTFNLFPSEVGISGDPERFITSSLWADLPENDLTSAFHFVHVRADAGGNCLPYEESFDCGFHGSGECLVTGIVKYVTDLVDATTDVGTRRTAVMMLIHLMADLHQPLHVGFAKDHGGVDIGLLSPVECSLHDLWDNYLVSTPKDKDSSDYGDLLGRERKSMLAMWPEQWDVVKDNTGSIVSAVKEWIVGIVNDISQRFTCPKAYKTDDGGWIVDKMSLDERYISDRSLIASQLVRLSGVRLAVLLNRIGRYINSKNRVERKKMQTAALKSPAVTSSVASPNPFSGLAIDDFDFNPQEFVFKEQENVAAVVTAMDPLFTSPPEQVVFDGVVFSDLILYYWRVSRWWVVTFRAKVVEKRLGNDWSMYDISFPRNSASVGKVISIYFDLEVLKGISVKTDDFVVAFIHYLRGVGVPAAASSLMRKAPPKVSAHMGVFAALPLVLVRNIAPNVGGNVHVGPFSGIELEMRSPEDARLTLASTARYVKKIAMQRELAARYASVAAPHVTNPDTQMELRNDYMVERVCSSLLHVTSSDGNMVFVTTTGSLQRSQTRPLHPLMGHMMQVSLHGRPKLVYLVDVGILDYFISGNQLIRIVQCSNRNGLRVEDFGRISLYEEVTQIQRFLRNPDTPLAPNSPVFQLMMYFNELTPDNGCLTVEWNQRG